MDPEGDLGKDPHPLLEMEFIEPLQGGEILDLHQMMDVGLDLHPLLKGDTQSPFGKDK